MRGEKYAVLRNIMQEKIKGRRSVGRGRVRDLGEWFGCSSNELFGNAVDRNKLARMAQKEEKNNNSYY